MKDIIDSATSKLRRPSGRVNIVSTSHSDGRPDDIDNIVGIKFDQKKQRWDLLPFGPLKEIVQVLTYGAHKYEPDNWQQVPDARSRYFSALMRHITAWNGEARDPESGFTHLAHAACCVLFLMWHGREE